MFDTGAGIITVAEWVFGSDGEECKGFWCDRWKVVTDKQVPIEGFRSTERWQVVALSPGDHILAVIPGCQVKGFVACALPPSTSRVRVLKGAP